MAKAGLLFSNTFIFLLLCFRSGSFKPAHGSHIVGFASLDYVSHNRILWKLGKELQVRGHKYTQILPSCAKEIYTDVDVKRFNTFASNKEIEDVTLKFGKIGEIGSFFGVFKAIQLIFEVNLFLARFCEDLIQDKSLMAELKPSVDLVLCDITNVCCFILADILNVSRVEVSPMGFAGLFGAQIFRYPYAPAYLALDTSSDPSTTFSFTNRLRCFVTDVLVAFTLNKIIPENVWEKYAKANSRYTNAADAWRNIGMCLIPHHFALDYGRPLGANIKVIGPILPEPGRDLPDDLNNFMTNNDKVVLVAFGTALSKYDPTFLQVIAEGLGKLPFAVLWKYPGDIMSTTIGNNTKIVKQIPQNDILAHLSTRVFVTHGGINSYQESVYHSVPMVVIPWFTDQFIQAIMVARKGLGVALDKSTMNPEDLTKAIVHVLNNKFYNKNVERFSALVKDRKRTAQEEGADWIEYALRHDGAPHLISEALQLPDYQLYMFDVFLFIVVLVFVILYLFLGLCCCICGSKADTTKGKKD